MRRLILLGSVVALTLALSTGQVRLVLGNSGVLDEMCYRFGQETGQQTVAQELPAPM